MICMLNTHKPELTTMGKSLIYNKSCWRQWLVESRSHGISVMENMSGVHADITFSTEEGPWSTVTTPYNSWIAPTLLADACCHIFLCRSGVHLSALHLSEKRLCRVLQFEEARRGSLEVSRGDASSSEVLLSECWRSCRKHSVKIVWNI